MTFHRALFGCLLWLSLALLFNVLFWGYLSTTGDILADTKALQFFTGYLIELSLSIDNMFVFILIFQYFKVPDQYQRRVLLWGVIGAVVMRLIFILAGVWVISVFHWLLYALGALLIFMGVKMFLNVGKPYDYSQSKLVAFLKRHLRMTSDIVSHHFVVRHRGLLYVTPLFLALICIECSDVLFALDSIPVIFSITTDPFIIYTSNIFAVMGLRSLYFLFVHMTHRFAGLQYGVMIILIFVGLKMLLAPWIHVPIWVTLGTVVLILGGSLILKNE
jgi:tellurite resistance protein TerC